MTSAAASRLFFVLAALIPYVLPPNIIQAWALVVVIGMSAFAGSIFDLAFLTWMAELIPAGVRGAFLGRRSRITGLVGQGVALLAAFGLDRWRSSQSGPGGFALLFVLAAVIGLSGLAFRSKDHFTEGRALTGPSFFLSCKKPSPRSWPRRRPNWPP